VLLGIIEVEPHARVGREQRFQQRQMTAQIFEPFVGVPTIVVIGEPLTGVVRRV